MCIQGKPGMQTMSYYQALHLINGFTPFNCTYIVILRSEDIHRNWWKVSLPVNFISTIMINSTKVRNEVQCFYFKVSWIRSSNYEINYPLKILK